MAAVNTSLDVLADTLKTDRQEAARAIIRIANNNMVNAVKLVSVNRGHDPRDYTMIAFGGGGGMHACAMAAELGIKKVVIPSQSAVFSAWGMLMCDLRRDYIQTQIVEMAGEDAATILDDTVRMLEQKALAEFAKEDIGTAQVEFQRFGRFRYQNQEHAVEVALPDGTIDASKIEIISESFHDNYEREYTYRLDSPIDLVSFHVVATAEVGKLRPEKLKPTGRRIEETEKGRRQVDFTDDGIHESIIYHGDLLEPGMTFTGPAVIEESGTTIVVLPGMPVHVDEYGNIHIQTNLKEATHD